MMKNKSLGRDAIIQRSGNSRKSRPRCPIACVPLFRYPMLLLPLLSLFGIFSALEAPYAPSSFPGVCEATSVDATAASATSDAFEKGRRLGERRRSQPQANNQAQKSRTYLSAPDKATSTAHDRAMYHLIKDMKPFLPPQDSVDDVEAVKARSLMAHDDPQVAAEYVTDALGFSVENRLTKLFSKAKTPECRAQIAQHYAYFISAIGKEKSLPFANFAYELTNECPREPKYDFFNLPEGITIGGIQDRVYRPPNPKLVKENETLANETQSEEEEDDEEEKKEEENETTKRYKHVVEYIDDPKDLRLLYVILTHDNPNGTMRLINALHEDGHLFVIHVDGKAESVYQELRKYYHNTSYVHFVPSTHRVRVNWGAFSMVNATLQALKYAFAIDSSQAYTHKPLEFHKVVHIASTSYPLRSNTEIRRRLASYPLNANFFDLVFKPTDPGSGSWHYFTECDDAVHRIYRLTPLVSTDFETDNTGVDLYTSSQWWIASRDFTHYLAEARPGTFVHKFLQYIEHVVVADEHFFGTVLRHVAPFCYAHNNDNFLHLQFDRWENEIQTEIRDERKCLMPNPDHCGRSPTTMTMDYLPILELCDDLFARKFDDTVDTDIKDIIDINRAREEDEFQRADLRKEKEGNLDTIGADELELPVLPKKFNPEFEGNGILIVAKETVNDETPLCLGLGPNKNKVKLTPCFYDWVRPTLDDGWEKGAVIIEETEWHNRWELGPCSSDGFLERMANGTMKMTPGKYSLSGPRCMLKQMDGVRAGRCIDVESDRIQPGGEVQVFPCRGRWHQFLSFGNGTLAPLGSIHMNIPMHIWKRIEDSGREQEPYMCIGVRGRGNKDEEEWIEDIEQEADDESTEDDYNGDSKDASSSKGSDVTLQQTQPSDSSSTSAQEKRDAQELIKMEISPLSNWKDKQVVTTSCSNSGAVVEFVIVPFIVEDEHNTEPDNNGENDRAEQVAADGGGESEEDEL